MTISTRATAASRLAASTVTGNLTVTSTGAITDSGSIVVGGRLTVETRNNAAAAITLDSGGRPRLSGVLLVSRGRYLRPGGKASTQDCTASIHNLQP